MNGGCNVAGYYQVYVDKGLEYSCNHILSLMCNVYSELFAMHLWSPFCIGSS